MTSMRPLYFNWDGEAMTPLSPQQADRQYVVGSHYRLVPYEERSPESHSHYFAALNECYRNLPEKIADEFVSFDRFRKWCLVKCGFCDETKIVAANHKEALSLAAFIGKQSDFAIVTIEDCVVRAFTAQSQKRSEMGRQRFEDSKRAVLDYASSLIGVSADDVRQNVGKAA